MKDQPAPRRTFPKQGQPWPQLRSELERIRNLDTSARHGRLNIYCHQGSEELHHIRLEASEIYAHTNAFLSKYEPGLKRMESDVLGMVKDLLGGDERTCAHITTGGTESIFCALHTARQWARERFPGIIRPEIVMPYSAHAAFDKACHFLDMEVVRVPVTADFRANVAAMERAITPSTIAIIGSAPCWPYGTIDPIPELAALARKARPVDAHRRLRGRLHQPLAGTAGLPHSTL